MKEREFELSRRTVLGSVGGIGVASAAGGLGTSAFFSDREDFTDNRLVAGELDLKVDWEEHYSVWSEVENNDRADDLDDGKMDQTGDPDTDGDGDPYDEDGNDTTDTDGDGENDFPIRMWDGEPGTTGSIGDLERGTLEDLEVGLPTDDNWLIAVPLEYVDDFMRNTAVEAFPDENDDGIQDDIQSRDDLSSGGYTLSSEWVEEEFRAQFANVPADLDSDLRTEATVNGHTTEPGDPLINLDDVKPGDFGEVTFSFHLFNNPGYIWLTGDLVVARENGHSEPEAGDGQETGPANEISNDLDTAQVELLDEIRVIAWHDDGDNVLEPTELVHSPHDVDSDSAIELTGDQRLVTDGVLSLREFLKQVSGDGIPMDADTTTPERDCYPNSTTRYVCVAWWLPVDHANEIQTDSVAFDLGFYTEQCRHNDGTSRMAPEGLDATVGSGDYSQTSYDRKLGMALRYGNSHYEDGSIGRAPYEQEIHPSTSGYGQNFAYESGVTYDFLATLEPGTETELAVFGNGLGRSVADSDLATGSYVTDATGGPTEGELALTVKAQSGSLTNGDSVTIEDVQVNGVPVSPTSLTATKGGTELQFMALSGLDFTQSVEVGGKLTFSVDEASLPTDDPHDVLTAVGIDWR